MLAQPPSPLLCLHVFISVVLILNNGLGGFSFSANDFHLKEEKNVSEQTSSSIKDVKVHKQAIPKPRWNLFGIPGDGYYIAALIGTPPQQVNLLVDTGSSNLAVAGTSSGELDLFFNASQSSTFISLNCSHLKVSYSQGWWQGSLGTDIVAVPSVSHSLQTRSFVALITKSHGFYVNGSHWQGILGLAFPELAQPNKTIQPWFDSVISARNLLAAQREESSVLSVHENFTNSGDRYLSGSARTFSPNDGLDLEEFIAKSKEEDHLKLAKGKSELRFPMLKDGNETGSVDTDYVTKTEGITETEDKAKETCTERISAKEFNSSAIGASHIVQETNSLTANSSEVLSSDESEAVIQKVRVGLTSKFSGILLSHLKAKNSAKEFLNSTQDEDVISVIRVPITSTGNESNFIDYSTSNVTEVSFLFKKNGSEISNEITLNSVAGLDFVSTISPIQSFSSDDYFESQQENSNDEELGELNLLELHKMQVTLKNESSGLEVHQKPTGASDLHDNSLSQLADYSNRPIPDNTSRSSEIEYSDKDDSLEKIPFLGKAEPINGIARRPSLLVNSSVSLESFTLELCGPWSSAPLFDAHEGRLALGADGDCRPPAYETPIVAPWFYEISVTGVSVGSTRLPLPCAVYNHHASIVDSGTTKLKLPQAALDAVVQALEEATSELLDEPLPLHFWRGAGHVCWSTVHEAWSRLPLLSIDIALSNSSSFSIELGPRSYLRPVLGLNSSEDSNTSVPAIDSNVSVAASMDDYGSTIPSDDSDSFTPTQAHASSISARYFNSSVDSDYSDVPVSVTTYTASYGSSKNSSKNASNDDLNIRASATEKKVSKINNKTLNNESMSTAPNALANSDTIRHDDHLRPKNVSPRLSDQNEPSHSHSPFSIDLHVNLNHPSSDHTSGSSLKEKATKKKLHNPSPVTSNQRRSSVRSHAEDGIAAAGTSSVVPCWSSGIELSDMGTVLGAVVLEGLCVHFDRGRGVVGFSEGSCGPRVRLSGPFLRRQAEICAAPHRDVMESDAGEAGTVVLAAILVLLCCPFALFVVRALWRQARHRFFSIQQAETTFLSLDESTSAA